MTDAQVREFIALIQQTLRQAEVPIDYGAREVDTPANVCKVIAQEGLADRGSSSSDQETNEPSVYKVRTHAADSHGRRSFQDTRFANNLACYTCGRQGHGYKSCPDRVCSRCHRRGHDTTNCRNGGQERYQDKRAGGRRYIKTVDRGGVGDEKAASISVKIQGQTICALLDTGARVNVMDKQTIDELGLTHHVKPESSHVYGICGTPVAVVGSIEIPIEVDDKTTEWTRVYVLEGKEQALLLGRQFLEQFGRVVFDWEDRTITLGKARAKMQETAVGGDPMARARSVKVMVSDEVKEPPSAKSNTLTSIQQNRLSKLLGEFSTLFNDRPGRTPGCEHAIDTGRAAPARSRPNRIPPRWEQEINTQLDEMLAQKLCRASSH